MGKKHDQDQDKQYQTGHRNTNDQEQHGPEQDKPETSNSRRKFLSDLTLGALGTVSAAGIISGCASPKTIADRSEAATPHMLPEAPDGEVLRAGLIGCGGRGTGAAVNFVDAGPNLEIVALGDVFQDQLDKCRSMLKTARDIEIPDENCFVGFDSYEKVIDAGVDVVLLVAPGHFRPLHAEAAVNAGKHVFQEKPVCVDPVGARKMDEVTQKAKQNNLCMVTGTIRRYQKDYVHTRQLVADGAIGEITGASIVRNGGALWWVERQSGWSDMEYMIRNWGNFTWLSGDTILEKFIHEVDVMSWYLGEDPVRAIGYGARHQRESGDQYDIFSVIYEYANGMQTHCATREISHCDNERSELIVGTEGSARADGTILNHKGEVIWQHSGDNVPDPYRQEHVELVTAIRTGNYINDSDEQIRSNRLGLMGRMSAYTGRTITWEEVLNSDLKLGPDVYAFRDYPNYVNGSPPLVGAPTPPTDRYS